MQNPSNVHLSIATITLSVVACASLLALDVNEFVAGITSDDKEVRYATSQRAGELGAAAIAPLGKLLVHSRREVSLTSKKALRTLVHDVGSPNTPSDKAREVSGALAKLLTADAATPVKLEVLHLIAFIGEGDVVAAVASFLGDADKHVRESARLALERIPGDAAVAALANAARSAAPDRRGDYLFSLGNKDEASVIGTLIEAIGDDSAAVRHAALQGLARRGAAQAVEHFQSELKDQDAATRPAVFTEYLRLAANLRDRGHAKLHDSICREVLTNAPLDFQREQALHMLSPEGSSAHLGALLVSLADQGARVRALAIRRFSKLQGDEVSKAMREAYSGSSGEQRAFLLRAIAEREGNDAQLLVRAASGSTDPEVKITALDLLGGLRRPGLEATFLELARSGSASVRPTAVKGYLGLAEERLKQATRVRRQAAEMYGQAIELPGTVAQISEAIRGLKTVGEPQAIDKLVPFLAHPVVGGDASETYVTLAETLVAQGEVDQAEPLLLKILNGKFPQPLKIRAADALKSVGRDPQANAIQAGFLFDWWLIGPIAFEGDGLATKYFPEKERVFEGVHTIGVRRYVWQRPRLLSTSGVIDLIPRFRRSSRRIAYAYTELNSPNEQKVLFKMGSDDAMACWLNDERIHFNPRRRGARIDEDSVEATLKAGKNLVLLKIQNFGGDWAFVFRITDREGKPIVLESLLDPR